MRRRRIHRVAPFGAALLGATLLACAGSVPADLGVREGRLAPCPATPNCVSSDAADEGHRVDPLVLAAPAAEAWEAAHRGVASLPRTRIVQIRPTYLRAECRSAVFRFTDDLELQLREADGTIAVRSASRVGRSDLGVNRRRVEALREALREGGVVR
jgi:uncharacterized protein (DUF1499 family)